MNTIATEHIDILNMLVSSRSNYLKGALDYVCNRPCRSGPPETMRGYTEAGGDDRYVQLYLLLKGVEC